MKMGNVKKVNFGFGISLFIIIVIGIISYINNLHSFQGFNMVIHTQDVLKKLSDISLTINESEYRINTYISLNDKNYLEDFYNSEKKLNIQLSELEKILEESQSKGSKIIDLKDVVNSRFKYINDILSANNSQTNFTNNFNENIFKIISDIEEKERNLLLNKENNNKRNSIRIIYTIIIGTAFAFIIILVSMIMIKKDIGKRILVEKKLRENETNLEDKVKERTEKLTESNNILNNEVLERKKAEHSLLLSEIKLKANIKELESFSYSISHDLRSPLRSIDGFSQAIYEDYYDSLDDEGKDYLKRIRLATQRMGTLIDDILNLSKIVRSDINIKDVNLSEIAEDVFRELQESYHERNVNVIIKENVYVKGDESLLGSVLDNLIGNAWKFTSKNENAFIEFGMIEEDQSIYFVRDNGAGFDMKYYDKLFGVFQRLHNFDDFKGTGIGLASVQKIILRHGGEIWAKAKPNEGATFYFTIGMT